MSRFTGIWPCGTATVALAFFLVLNSAHARDALQSFSLAAKAGDASFIRQLPELGLGPQTRDGLKNNLLMLAIRDDGEALALALMDQAAWQHKEVLNHENQLGETALMIAAIKGAGRAADRLIALGAEVNRNGWTALHYAATAGHVALIQLLIERSAYVDSASPNGTTPLMMAARFNHRPAAEALLRSGADPTQTNQSGLTARDYAIENNNSSLAFWLEMEEISFTNKYLSNLPANTSEKGFDQVIKESGGSVTYDRPVPIGPGGGAEVGGPIR